MENIDQAQGAALRIMKGASEPWDQEIVDNHLAATMGVAIRIILMMVPPKTKAALVIFSEEALAEGFRGLTSIGNKTLAFQAAFLGDTQMRDMANLLSLMFLDIANLSAAEGEETFAEVEDFAAFAKNKKCYFDVFSHLSCRYPSEFEGRMGVMVQVTEDETKKEARFFFPLEKQD